MSSGIPARLAQVYPDTSRPALIDTNWEAYHEKLERIHREAALVGRLLANGISNRRTRSFLKNLRKHAICFESLRAAFDRLREVGGEAPGVDGVTYSDLSEGEWYAVFRNVVKAVANGTYRPDGLRHAVMKQGAKLRPLDIPTCRDRIIERAILGVVSPLMDIGFEEFSYGFRPGCSCWGALARAKVITEEEGAYHWLKLDIENAFGSIPRDRLTKILHQRIPSPEMVDLIELIVRRPGTKREKLGAGIHQGGPLSPCLLNVFLDTVLDKPLSRLDLPVWSIRYADDILLIGRTAGDVEEVEGVIRTLLEEAS